MGQSRLLRPLRAVAKGGGSDINLLCGRGADEIKQLWDLLETALSDHDTSKGQLDPAKWPNHWTTKARALLTEGSPR